MRQLWRMLLHKPPDLCIYSLDCRFRGYRAIKLLRPLNACRVGRESLPQQECSKLIVEPRMLRIYRANRHSLCHFASPLLTQLPDWSATARYAPRQSLETSFSAFENFGGTPGGVTFFPAAIRPATSAFKSSTCPSKSLFAENP